MSKDPPAPALRPDPFAPALRAEIEGLVTRYEALARSHQEALAAAREHEVTKLRTDLASLLADRERGRTQEAAALAQLKTTEARAAHLDRDLNDARKQLAQALQRMEALQTEARASVEQERDAARRAQAQQQAQLADLQAQLDAARGQLSDAQDELARARTEATHELARARAEATQRLAQVEGALREVQQQADSLSEAFSSERAFIEACQRVDGTALHDALRQAFGADLTSSPATYATLKARRPDAILTHAFKERGRLIAAAPLTSPERGALASLAAAGGCELIEPEHGMRFSSSTMDKAMVQADPAEEGNVLGCLMPGLRLAGTDGALVFPRVLVATG
jgi:predicted  nucleic acid-binding Zn-ribbon protein